MASVKIDLFHQLGNTKLLVMVGVASEELEIHVALSACSLKIVKASRRGLLSSSKLEQ